MKQQIASIAAVVVGLAVFFAAVPRANAQNGAKILLTGRLAGRPVVNVVVDTAQGSQLKNPLGEGVAVQFADSDWTVTDDSRLTVTKGGKVLLTAFHWANPEKTWFLLHARTPTMTVDGNLGKYTDDPQKGWVQVYVSALSNDGKSWATFNIGGPLTFGQQENGSGDGGFSAFGG